MIFFSLFDIPFVKKPLDAIRTSYKFRYIFRTLVLPLSECASVKQANGLPMKLDEGVYDTKTLLEGHEKGIMDSKLSKLSKFGPGAIKRCNYFGMKRLVNMIKQPQHITNIKKLMKLQD